MKTGTLRFREDETFIAAVRRAAKFAQDKAGKRVTVSDFIRKALVAEMERCREAGWQPKRLVPEPVDARYATPKDLSI